MAMARFSLFTPRRSRKVWRIADGAWQELTPGTFALPPGSEEKFSADGNWFARNSTPGGEGPIEIYSLTGARAVRILSTPWPRSKLGGFNPDSTLLAIRGLGRPEIVVVDPLTGAVRHSLRLPESANVAVRRGAGMEKCSRLAQRISRSISGD
jgi:hypothetical protein